MPPNPEATKLQLINAAEQLFAERGIDAVSLREITTAAGVRNSTALQYHFGDRHGILREVLRKHHGEVEQRRHALLDAYDATEPHVVGDPDELRLLVREGRDLSHMGAASSAVTRSTRWLVNRRSLRGGASARRASSTNVTRIAVKRWWRRRTATSGRCGATSRRQR